MEVIAFVGPSGSGKSHRASLVAVELGTDAVIDDGLLVREGKILAGESAKRAPSKLEAVRRAIFAHPADAERMRRRLQEVQPERVLVLGTSLGMVQRICGVLALPSPARVMHIEDIASPEEIRHAQRVRREQGKHVIPAPTVEVKRTFSGYLVDPLRFILRSKERREMVIEKSVVRPTWSYLGRFTIDDTCVSSIAARAAQEAPGIARVRRVTMETWSDGLVLHLDVTVLFGQHIPTVLQRARDDVRHMVEQMTALNVLAANITAKRIELPSPEEMHRLIGTP
ncbi:MAG: hypothetical protein M0Z66_03370 [Thermaerobacter sp.]|nr:hypothetical protein [Thermaerobacter sp.]